MAVAHRTWRSPCGQIEVVVEESSVGFTSTGMKVWTAGEHLSALLCAHRTLVHGAVVLELGAGCGLVSAVAASLGAADVTATDQSVVLPRLHCTSLLGTPAQRFHVAELTWGVGADLPPWLPRRFDLVLGSDITYACREHTSFLQLLWILVQEERSATCLLAHFVRGTEQAALLWHEMLAHWPGVVWIYSGHDALIKCHNLDTEHGAELTDEVVTFALSAVTPSEGSASYPSYAAFVSKNMEHPLQPPELSCEVFEEGMIGPQQYIPSGPSTVV